MIHVLVESNWVFDYCAPVHRRKEGAAELLDQARSGMVRLHVPAVCLREGAESVRKKCQPRIGDLQDFRRTMAAEKKIGVEANEAVIQLFELYRSEVRRQLDAIDQLLDELVQREGVEVFALDEAMLQRCLDLRRVADVQQMRPFDEAILAAVLVRGERLRDGGATDVRFCTLDTDLWPWAAKTGAPRPGLLAEYDAAGVWVQSDFLVRPR